MPLGGPDYRVSASDTRIAFAAEAQLHIPLTPDTMVCASLMFDHRDPGTTSRPLLQLLIYKSPQTGTAGSSRLQRNSPAPSDMLSTNFHLYVCLPGGWPSCL